MRMFLVGILVGALSFKLFWIFVPVSIVSALRYRSYEAILLAWCMDAFGLGSQAIPYLSTVLTFAAFMGGEFARDHINI